VPVILAALLVTLFIILAAVVLAPVALIQRYRAGTARRPARGWLATINLVGITLSIAVFLFGAAMTNIWVPQAFAHACGGLAIGALLGLVGLWLTRWDEAGGRPLHAQSLARAGDQPCCGGPPSVRRVAQLAGVRVARGRRDVGRSRRRCRLPRSRGGDPRLLLRLLAGHPSPGPVMPTGSRQHQLPPAKLASLLLSR
jgi:hypothetical protein